MILHKRPEQCAEAEVSILTWNTDHSWMLGWVYWGAKCSALNECPLFSHKRTSTTEEEEVVQLQNKPGANPLEPAPGRRPQRRSSRRRQWSLRCRHQSRRRTQQRHRRPHRRHRRLNQRHRPWFLMVQRSLHGATPWRRTAQARARARRLRRTARLKLGSGGVSSMSSRRRRRPRPKRNEERRSPDPCRSTRRRKTTTTTATTLITNTEKRPSASHPSTSPPSQVSHTVTFTHLGGLDHTDMHAGQKNLRGLLFTPVLASSYRSHWFVGFQVTSDAWSCCCATTQIPRASTSTATRHSCTPPSTTASSACGLSCDAASASTRQTSRDKRRWWLLWRKDTAPVSDASSNQVRVRGPLVLVAAVTTTVWVRGLMPTHFGELFSKTERKWRVLSASRKIVNSNSPCETALRSFQIEFQRRPNRQCAGWVTWSNVTLLHVWLQRCWIHLQEQRWPIAAWRRARKRSSTPAKSRAAAASEPHDTCSADWSQQDLQVTLFCMTAHPATHSQLQVCVPETSKNIETEARETLRVRKKLLMSQNIRKTKNKET